MWERDSEGYWGRTFLLDLTTGPCCFISSTFLFFPGSYSAWFRSYRWSISSSWTSPVWSSVLMHSHQWISWLDWLSTWAVLTVPSAHIILFHSDPKIIKVVLCPGSSRPPVRLANILVLGLYSQCLLYLPAENPSQLHLNPYYFVCRYHFRLRPMGGSWQPAAPLLSL